MANQKKNKHGLTRPPSDGVERQVRQECGFGCVICGQILVDIEHFDPDFAEAHEHNPAGMALLCRMHHDRVTSGMTSKRKVAEARRNPWCLQQGYSFGYFETDERPFTIYWGDVAYRNTNTVINVDGHKLMTVTPGRPMSINASLVDDRGDFSLSIKNNVYSVDSVAFHARQRRNRLVVNRKGRRGGPGSVALQIKFDTENRIVVERADLQIKGQIFSVDNDETRIGKLRVRRGTRIAINDVDDGMLVGKDFLVIGASSEARGSFSSRSCPVRMTDKCPCESRKEFIECHGR